MAEDLHAAEVVLGMESFCIDNTDQAEREQGFDADVHVVHTNLPDEVDDRTAKKIWVAHGTPEVMFQESITQAARSSHGVPDAWMASTHLLRTSDAVVTFWERHKVIWESMMDKGRTVDLVPMGVSKSAWHPEPSKGKFDGTPSILTAENCHMIKWPLDLVIAMSWVLQEIRSARLHMIYLPLDQSRFWSVLAFNNRVAYRSHISPISYAQADLRNAFCSVDYYAGLVRYGDYNRVCLEAAASGCPVISYRGNPYADYWVDEGDQRVIAGQLKLILNGQVPAREATPVPDITETASAMADIYRRLI